MVDLELCGEMETFVTNNPASAWTPSLHLWLARRARLRCGYSLAMDHYEAAFSAVESTGITGPESELIAVEASGGLAKLLALTGQLPAFDALEAAATQLFGRRPASPEWGWAHEMRAWASKHPSEAYKCGLYCLDQLGRLTQPGAFFPKNITETPSSTNGFTAADLVALGTGQGLRVRAGLLSDLSTLPVPCILHLRSEHFVIIAEQRGSLYEVIDPVVNGPKWLTPTEIAQEATGCAIISDAVSSSVPTSFSQIDPASASNYHGRCHGPLPNDHNDTGCPTPCECASAAGDGGSAPPPPTSATQGTGNGRAGCPSCASSGSSPTPQGSGSSPALQGGGMAAYHISEPYLNVWLDDTPLQYTPAYGPSVKVHLAYHDRDVASILSLNYWHGAQFGNSAGNQGLWSCSLLSFAELSTDGYTVDLMLPGGGWAAFTFPTNSTRSTINYQHNLWLEQLGSGSVNTVTNLVLHYPDGSQSSY
jgi:hypothetical protein